MQVRHRQIAEFLPQLESGFEFPSDRVGFVFSVLWAVRHGEKK
jgi:hypothetical protein